MGTDFCSVYFFNLDAQNLLPFDHYSYKLTITINFAQIAL